MSELLNKITQGDTIEEMRKIADKSVDMILCDLPYGTTDISWDTVIPIDSLWEQYTRIIKDNGAILLFGAEPFSSKLRSSNPSIYRYDWYWVKNRPSGMSYAKYQPMRSVETISVFYKKVPTYNPQMTKRTEEELKRMNKTPVKGKVESRFSGIKKRADYSRSNNTHKFPTNVLYYKTPFGKKEKYNHPTQKPTDLIEYLIKTYSNECDVILDNCIGSGTTAVAAIKTGRQFIGIERETEYCEIARKRIDDAFKEVTTC